MIPDTPIPGPSNNAKGQALKTQMIRRIAGPVIGAGGGYGYYKWVTCNGGG